jgi:iron complex transport system ATP-binding protein
VGSGSSRTSPSEQLNREPLLELTDATVTKQGRRVLERVTLAIRAGEHTAIVGPNGSGKSSLINLLTLQDRPLAHTDGSPAVRVFGLDRWDVFELRARLGIISGELQHRFVNGNSAGSILGEDAVVSGLFATHGFLVNRDVTTAMRARARESLAQMDAEHLGSKRLDEMSTGEARRVLLARALVGRPEALILDEPTNGLDLIARHRLLELVNQVAARGTTVVIVTHHVEEIVPAIQRVVLLKQGRIANAGAKAAMLTDACLSALFDAPISVHEAGGYYDVGHSRRANL